MIDFLKYYYHQLLVIVDYYYQLLVIFFKKHIHKDNVQLYLLLQTSYLHYNLERSYLCFLYTQYDSRS